MTNSTAVSRSAQPDVAAWQWLALSLTPGMGPIRGHSRLNEIYDPPVALYVRGDVTLLSQPGLGVVGTRHPTPYGMGMAERLSNDLSSRGLVIVSRMARGVDTHAHRGALNGKGKTVAIWGTGIDVPYPRENKRIADAIIIEAGGVLVSEFPIGIFAAPQTSQFGIELLAALHLACWQWRQESTAAHALPRVVHWSRGERSLPFPAT